mgnify:CR=1 FL=1
MHMQGNPKTMQQSPHYENVMMDVDRFLQENIQRCVDAGIEKNQIILDPGFGFGKNLAHNYQNKQQPVLALVQ